MVVVQIEELAEELEEQKELAANTLQELETLNLKYRENLEKVEELQMNVSFFPCFVRQSIHKKEIF